MYVRSRKDQKCMYYTFMKSAIDELKKSQIKVMKDLPVLKTKTLVFYSVPKKRKLKKIAIPVWRFNED